jgi:hypothetical protein
MCHLRISGALLALSCSLLAGTGWASSDTQKAEGSKGTAVEDLGRGLKSAAKNVEKEIPKIGSAIGETFKKLTNKNSDKNSDKQSTKSPSKDKK